MAKGNRGHRRISSGQFRSTPYVLPCRDMSGDFGQKKSINALDGKDWKDATCSVCMEFPHSAVLLLCSSHDKGCRPYMCGTSFRYANCLDQYKKAYTKVSSSNQIPPQNDSVENPNEVLGSSWAGEKHQAMELACPLCRGQVKGWTVVEPARAYLNAKKRSCIQDCCPFVGNYKELRKHVRAEHPSARPREVDPVLEQKWRRLERERDRDDVMSTIRSTMPGAMVLGDYVIEGNNYRFDTDGEGGINVDGSDMTGGLEVGFDSNLVNVFLLLHAFGPGSNGQGRRARQPDRIFSIGSDENAIGTPNSIPLSGFNSIDADSDSDTGGLSLVTRLRHHGRAILGRSGRRRRRREANESPR